MKAELRDNFKLLVLTPENELEDWRLGHWYQNHPANILVQTRLGKWEPDDCDERE